MRGRFPLPTESVHYQKPILTLHEGLQSGTVSHKCRFKGERQAELEIMSGNLYRLKAQIIHRVRNMGLRKSSLTVSTCGRPRLGQRTSSRVTSNEMKQVGNCWGGFLEARHYFISGVILKNTSRNRELCI